MAPGRRKGNLSMGLDREASYDPGLRQPYLTLQVHQVVRKVIDERTQYDDHFRPTSAIIYDEIRRSNSSLNRKPKKLLEDSIGRVIEIIQQEAAESDSEAYLEPELDSRPSARPTSNGMNRSIVAAWSGANGSANDTGANTPAQTVDEGTAKASQTTTEPPRKKRKRGPEITASPPTHISVRDLGGVGAVVKEFSDLLTIPLLCPEVTATQSLRGILITGPPGCGKTTIANAIAAMYGVNFIEISAPSLVSGMSGESEKALRDCFESAKAAAPCLLFLDEIDAIAPKRESASREMEKRIVAQLATLLDGLDPDKNDGKVVIVLAATNRPDALDPALRRGGRFDKEINMNVPNELMREQILKALTRKIPLAEDVNLKAIAVRTPGYVGADLRDLVSTANSTAIRRFQDSLALEAAVTAATESSTLPGHPNDMDVDPSSMPATQSTTTELSPDTEIDRVEGLIHYLRNHPHPATSITVTHNDFLVSLPKISPSALREGFATVPTTTFNSIGGLNTAISRLNESLITPILEPGLYSSLGLKQPSGTLLFGPPGCGKTLLARAIANASHANFISVKGPELLNKYVGESERAVRNVFQRARSSVPVIIFFDELDALVPARNSSASEASSRVVNTLLTELDGVGADRSGIYIIAATNRPELIDAAMLRPGRLDTMLYISLPDARGRVEILKALTRKMPGFVWDERMTRIAEAAEGLSGADLDGLVTQAGYAAIRRLRKGSLLGGTAAEGDKSVSNQVATTEHSSRGMAVEDFEAAAADVRRSVSAADMRDYERLRKKWEEGMPQGG